MHNNFYFLRQLTKALAAKIDGAVISECFSQSRDELIIRFEMGGESFFIRASLSPALGCLSFPSEFRRARKNSVDLLEPVIGRRVTGLRQFNNDRSFAIHLSEEYTLLFKMHGNRTNIVLFREGIVQDLFRKNIAADLNIDQKKPDRTIDWSREYFDQHAHELPSVYFTFGKLVWQYLEKRGFSSLTADEKWHAVQKLLKLLDSPTYYITILNGKPALSMLEFGEVKKVIRDPLEAANEFFYFFTQEHAFLREKNRMLALLKSRIEAGENYCLKNSRRLEQVLQDSHYKVWADVLMANLHAIDPGAEEVVLENLYDDQRPVRIRIRKDLTPQKMAEVYYRKAKNRHIEIDRLEKSIGQKQEEVAAIRKQIYEVETATDLKSLKALQGRIMPESGGKTQAPLPYHEFCFRDFRIWVGRNAQANDLLTLKHAYKDDLWLHAKDVSGSHVLIKHQAGKTFPKDVVEYAASLAAYNSKRKNESLCPVIVTPKKFVRKRKGDPPGMVVVEKEEVILVPPRSMTPTH